MPRVDRQVVQITAAAVMAAEQRGDLRLLASPSTCVQFAPGSEEFQVDRSAPGYRWLRLHADGRLDTGVSRVTGIHFEVDYSVKGY